MNEKSSPILRVCNERPRNSRSERSEFEYGLSAPGADLMRRVVVPTALRGNGCLAFFRPDANDDSLLYTMRSGLMQLFLHSAWARLFASAPGRVVGTSEWVRERPRRRASLRAAERGPGRGVADREIRPRTL